MATDQKTSTMSIDPELPGSVIENELPTYRAISISPSSAWFAARWPSSACAHPLFYLAAILAIVLGIVGPSNDSAHFPTC